MTLPVAAPFLGFGGLAQLISPIEAQSFIARYWENEVLLVRDRCAARDSLALGEWEDLVIRAIEKGKKVEILSVPAAAADQAPELAKIQDAFAQGRSIRIVNAQEVFAPLETLCATLTSELSHPVRVNIYITPPNRQGLDPHVDDHDVFVVQMSGRKRWRLYGEPYLLPLEHRPRLQFESHMNGTWGGADWGARAWKLAEDEQPSLDTPLETGQMFYVPRGVVHVASSMEATSVHATIGVHSTRIADLAALVVDRMAREDPALRRSLPLGFARYLGDAHHLVPEVEAALRRVTPRAVRDAFEELAARHIANRKEAIEKEAREAADLAAKIEAEPRPLADDEELRFAPDTLVTTTETSVSLRRFQKGTEDAHFPKGFERAIIEIVHQRTFRPTDLNALSTRSARNLVRHLIDKGFVLRLPIES